MSVSDLTIVPYTSNIFKCNLHCPSPSQKKIWLWLSQVKCPFERCYYWWVLRDVLVFHFKNVCHYFLERLEHCEILLGWRVQWKSLEIAQLDYNKWCCSLHNILSNVSDKTNTFGMWTYVVRHWWCLGWLTDREHLQMKLLIKWVNFLWNLGLYWIFCW